MGACSSRDYDTNTMDYTDKGPDDLGIRKLT